MKYFAEYSSKLSPHSEFSPKAFISDEYVSQQVCNFVLALALAHNDFKNYNIINDMISKSIPDGKPQRSSVWGEYSGIKLHVIRLHIGFVHELFKLIQRNKKILEDSFFIEVINNINKRARKSWDTLSEAALEEELAPAKANPLFMIRNKVAFHYDAKELAVGYNNGFFENGNVEQDACISLGNILENVRFYFADKAIQGYLEKEIDADANEFFTLLEQVMRNINIALYNICITFIQRRGFAWRKPARSE